MNQYDSGDLNWEGWRKLVRHRFKNHDETLKVAQQRAASRLVLSPKTVDGYLKKSDVAFRNFRALNESLGVDIYEALAALGAIPNSLGQAMVERERALAANQTLLEQVSKLSRISGAALVARSVLESQSLAEWAFACCPAIEGPSGYELHVANRISLVATGVPELTDDEVRLLAIQELGDALTTAGAVSIGDVDQKQFPVAKGIAKSLWSVEVLDASRPPHPSVAKAQYDRIVILSTSSRAWPSDVGSLIAYRLGFGYANDCHAAITLFGYPAPGARETAAGFQVLTSSAAHLGQYVVSGCIYRSGQPFDDSTQHPILDFVTQHDDEQTLIVLLDQTDDLYNPQLKRRTQDVVQLESYRTALRTAAEQSHGPVLIIETTEPHHQGTEWDRRNTRWWRAMATAATVLNLIDAPRRTHGDRLTANVPTGFRNFWRDFDGSLIEPARGLGRVIDLGVSTPRS
jgi:hypothetical protein